METIGQHSKISVTAKLVAYFRQFSDIPYAKEIADYTRANEAFQKIIDDTALKAEDIKEFAPVFEARYKSIVNLIEKSEINQVLELASGFSLRGLSMTRHKSLHYVESDLEELTEEKVHLISTLQHKQAAEDCGNHYVVSANALEPEQLSDAAKSLDREQKLIVVNEGLIQYFSVTERETLAQNVHQLLKQFQGGLWITPDFSFKADVQNVSESRKKLREAITGVTERTMYEAAFADEEELNQFFANAGFSAELHYQIDETPNFTSLSKWNFSPQFLDRVRQRLRIWVLQPL